jgi:hypothetical protein
MPSPCVKGYSTRTTETNMGTDFSCTAEIFNFTKGRFVTNEQHELAQRHRTFNVKELAQHAARTVKADRLGNNQGNHNQGTEVEVLAINSRQGVVNQLNWNVLKACKP